MKAKVRGQVALFCDEGCEGGFRADRDCGVIYPAIRLEMPAVEGGAPTYRWVGVEVWSVEANRCAYCEARLELPSAEVRA